MSRMLPCEEATVVPCCGERTRFDGSARLCSRAARAATTGGACHSGRDRADSCRVPPNTAAQRAWNVSNVAGRPDWGYASGVLRRLWVGGTQRDPAHERSARDARSEPANSYAVVRRRRRSIANMGSSTSASVPGTGTTVMLIVPTLKLSSPPTRR
ncbi:MAG: hypothetical protein H6Q91_2760 [Deltaproteobacteria bacterium]|nr:hypothetical protein [Deltaproteobacteria bacterium]